MASIQGIYLALFGRPADPEGLAYWNEQTNNGADLTKIIDVMASTPEAISRFEGMTNTEIVTTIYQALFARDPDAEGLAFFVAKLDSGELSLETVAINILDGAQGDDLTIIQNREQAANNFTESLDTQEEIDAYSGDNAAAYGRQYISGVTSDPNTIPTKEQAQEGITNDLPTFTPDEGQEPDAGQGTGGAAENPPTLEERAEDIMAEWADLDAQYYGALPDQVEQINADFVRLGIEYVEFLKDGGSPLLDMAKGDGETRDQSFHDNLLGNLGEDALDWRFSGNTNLHDALLEEIKEADDGVLLRPYEGGYSPEVAFNAAAAWDLVNDIPRADLIQTEQAIGDTLQTDRTAPESIELVDGDITLVVDSTKTDTGFYRYQGAKILNEDDEYFDLEQGATFTFDFFIDPDWATDGLQQEAGAWIEMQNDAGDLDGGGRYSIVEYIDNDKAKADATIDDDFVGFRFWNSYEGWDEYVAYDGSGDVSLSFAFTENSHTWFLNGDTIYTDTGSAVSEVDVLQDVIFNAVNFGTNNEDYTYKNISLTTVISIDEVIIGGVGDNVINGGTGNDLIWGDFPTLPADIAAGLTYYTPETYGDDKIDGGVGTNVIVLGTEKSDIQLGGQDTVQVVAGSQGDDVIFNFNFGPTDRYDDIEPGGSSNVDSSEPGADLTFDILEFSGYSSLQDLLNNVTVKIGQDNDAYADKAEKVIGSDFGWSGNIIDTGDADIYTGNANDFEIVLEFNDGGSVTFANAMSKWEKAAFLGSLGVSGYESYAPLGDGTDENNALNDLIYANGDDSDPTDGLVTLNVEQEAALIGMLQSQGNIDLII